MKAVSNLFSKKKICIVSISLAKGGAERSTALLTKMLHDLGHEVHLVILEDNISYDHSGELYNLGKGKKKNDNILRRVSRFRKLKKFIEAQNFDTIIDNRARNNGFREVYYLNYIYSGQRIIYVVHSGAVKNYLGGESGILSNYTKRLMAKKVAQFVAVSNDIKKVLTKTYGISKVVKIYNPIEEIEENLLQIEEDYILFVGRLVDEVKNLRLLLHAYAKSQLPEINVKLFILGDGPDLELMKSMAVDLKISNQVKFLGFKKKVQYYYFNAKFTILTSRYEGFPRVLIESLSVGTPVVSVDCISGPSEIISHEENGLLVENYNADKLTLAINRMYKDNNLYITCKKNAKSSAAHLKMKNIALQWEEII